MMNGVIMVQGTGSNVGKSILVAALCRVLRQEGYSVAPFKAQNMALNSFVTLDGCEIGRAQAFQAEACGIAPTVEMNPVLLKPTGEKGSQVIVLGKPIGNMKAVDYYEKKKDLFPTVVEAFHRLKKKYDVIVIEGAGSPAEINLKNDFSNMGIAKAVNAPVLIVGDIDCGGVFAWMKGTFDLLEPQERELVKGFIINKFRGDKLLLQPGVEMFERMIDRKVVGVLPYINDIYLDAEDSQDIVSHRKSDVEGLLKISVIKLPRISNFTDFAPLACEEDVSLEYVATPRQLEGSDCVIIPGSKNSIEDMAFLEKTGLAEKIRRMSKKGVLIVGICGGFQMLGQNISDEGEHESSLPDIAGLSLLPIKTTFHKDKALRQTSVTTKPSPFFPEGIQASGYEIHMGQTELLKAAEVIPLFQSDAPEVLGIADKAGTLLGTYLHDFFHHTEIRTCFLNRLRRGKGYGERNSIDFHSFKEGELDRLARTFRENTDISYIKSLL